MFNYAGGAHNVAEVSAADYASCSAANALSSDGSSATTIALKTAGKHYFICGVPGHCAAGQKLNVRVLKSQKARSSAPSPSPAPSATAPAPAAASPRAGDTSGSSASTPPAAATSSDGGAATTAPAPNSNGAGVVRAGYAVALAMAASMAMLQ